MKLNIVTSASNSVGRSILKKIANPNDITIGLTRRELDIENVIKVKITDLTNIEKTRQELGAVLSDIDIDSIERVNIFHNCCYAVCEIFKQDDFSSDNIININPKTYLLDEDKDGIDDRALHSLVSTFKNVHSVTREIFDSHPMSIGTVCSLTDHKSYIPDIFQSMVKTNWMLRKKLMKLVKSNNNNHAVVISASTVKTDTEKEFRKFCKDQKYRVSGEQVATALVGSMKAPLNAYIDIPLYIKNPQYSTYYKEETNEQMTERLKKEIGLI